MGLQPSTFNLRPANLTLQQQQQSLSVKVQLEGQARGRFLPLLTGIRYSTSPETAAYLGGSVQFSFCLGFRMKGALVRFFDRRSLRYASSNGNKTFKFSFISEGVFTKQA